MPSEPMRPVFTCVICGCVYMPPKAMAYPHLGTTASPFHCGAAGCRRAAAAIPPVHRDLYAKLAWAQAAQWTAKEPEPGPEPARRRGRAATRPGGSRSKLR
ncbi:hypothetical protein FGW37_03120 [Streptomyces rectiverticillatus]|uniref:hypothetical protein n=1 Tax=Streptomyces rectiverticillatus TaxID=173860 RepID=UPI0015C405E7|nr:hypothetical protein [Streptomyces rectiverticillatus]QLE70730.1 hypothetical protein FGW37_03120 [Streptomyces rectiverticillatus]